MAVIEQVRLRLEIQAIEEELKHATFLNDSDEDQRFLKQLEEIDRRVTKLIRHTETIVK